MTSSITGLSSKDLSRAAALKERIEKLTRDLNRILGAEGSDTATRGAGVARSGRRSMSPAARARIAAAMRKRWAKAKAAGKNAL
jgi:hypothetical protein